MSDVNDMYHTCRWCKHCKNGMCYRGALYVEGFEFVYDDFVESGRLSECVDETLRSISTFQFKQELLDQLEEWKLSKHKIQEFSTMFDNLLVQFLDEDCRQELDDNISVLYRNVTSDAISTMGGIVIKDPNTFYCKEWE